MTAWNPIMRYRKPPSRNRKVLIVALASLLICALWLVVLEQVRTERSAAVTATIRMNMSRARSYEAYARRTLQAADATIDHLILVYEQKLAQPGGRRPVALLEDSVTNSSIFAGAMVATPDGRLLASTASAAGLPRDFAALGGGAATGPSLSVSPPLRAPSGETRLYLSRRSSVAGRDVVAILPIAPGMLLDPEERTTRSGETDITQLIGQDGLLRVRRVGERQFAGGDMSAALRQHGDAAEGTYQARDPQDGVLRYTSYRHVEGYPLVVEHAVAANAAMAAPDRHREAYLAGGVIATALVLVAMLAACGALDELANHDRQMTAAERRLIDVERIGQVGDWSYDPTTDRINWSTGFSEIYGISGLSGMSLTEIKSRISPEDSRNCQEAIDRALRDGESGVFHRLLKRPDGSRRLHEVVVRPTRNRAGDIVGVHGFARDITTSKRLEELEARLVDLSRLDAMHLMAATLAHEINQPLASAANYLAASRRMLTGTDTAELARIEGGIRDGEAQIRHASKIIQRVHGMISSRIERKPIAIAASWARAAQLVRHTSDGKIIRIQQAIAPGADIAIADDVQLSQVFSNLMRNAVEAAPSGEVIIGLSTSIEGETVQLSIRDNGTGLTAPDQDVFSPMASTKEAGFGLGLVVSRTIIEAHGGNIWVASSGTGGTVISFTLPAPVA